MPAKPKRATKKPKKTTANALQKTLPETGKKAHNGKTAKTCKHEKKNAPAVKKRKVINVALQGGGAHGAFTWGVLDALLEDDRMDIESISATSAGAMNAAIMIQGLEEGGIPRAREMLTSFWQQVSQAGVFYSPVQSTASHWANLLNPLLASTNIDEAASFSAFETLTHFVSPYQFNPLNINPLRTILGNLLDITRLKQADSVKLFVSATCVRTGIGRIFTQKELTVDTLLASAALPNLFQAVKVGKDYYWDGGYSGNPSLWPLFYASKSSDILIIHVNPIIRNELPDRATSIDNRLNEITFNSSLLDELRAIAFVKKLVVEEWLKDKYKDRLRNMLIHAIRADKVLADFSVASKFNTDWTFLTNLRDLGRAEGKNWINKNWDALGKRDTVDIGRDYLDISAGG